MTTKRGINAIVELCLKMTAVNDAPVAADVSITTNEDNAYSGTLTATGRGLDATPDLESAKIDGGSVYLTRGLIGRAPTNTAGTVLHLSLIHISEPTRPY